MNFPDMNKAKKRTNEKVEYIYNQNQYDNFFSNKKYFIRTYGCQMNIHDSEEIKAWVEQLGFSECTKLEEADLVILNTCAIRENVHDKVFGYLGRCKHLKATKKDLIVALTGCMPQQEIAVDEIKNKHPYIDIVIGTHNINDLPKLIVDKLEKQNIQVFSKEGEVYENVPFKRDSNIKAWVNIMLGCDKFCTYCIVPYTRGKQRSRKSIDIINEINQLINDGYKEVTLLGQNVNAYGKDLENEISFAELLSEVAKTNIERIRFVTSHPWDFTDDMITVISKYPNIMHHVHLPVQSGSNKILKKMGRRYTSEEYITLYNKIKESIPDCGITTDIIVGFPNETEEDFQATLNIVEQCKFDSAFTYIYSAREGTPAANMKDIIPYEEKNKRLQILNKIVNNNSLINNKKELGKTLKVLVEGVSTKNENKLYGYSEQMKLVNFEGDKRLIGQIINVEITQSKSFSLDGKIIAK